MAGESGSNVFLMFRRKDGKRVWITVSWKPVFKDDGSYFGYRVSGLDRTEQKAAEQSLQESEELGRMILEAAGEGLLGVDAQGCIMFINQSGMSMLGYTQQELLGLDPHNLIHHTKADGSDHPRQECPIHQCYTRGKERRVSQDIFWKKGGTAVPVEFIAKPISRAGKILGAVVSFMDITGRLKSEKELREQAEQIRFMMDYADMYYWQINTVSGELTYASTGWFDRKGYAKNQIPRTQAGFDALIHPDDIGQIQKKMTDELQGQTDSLTVIFRFKGPQKDQWFWTRGALRIARRNNRGEPEILVGLNKDITERQNLIDQAQLAQERLNFSLDTAGAFYWQAEVDTGKLSFLSTAFFRQMGLSQEQVPQTIDDVYRWVHPDDLPGLKESTQRHIAGQTFLAKADYRFASPKGEWRWLTTVSRIIEQDDMANPVWIGGLTMDITDRQDLLEQVRLNQERLRIISDHTYDWQSWRDLDGNLIWVNKAVERVTGFTEKECMAMSDYPYPLIDQEYWQTYQECTQTVFEKKIRQEILLHIQRKDGTMVWVSEAYEPVMDETGTVIGIAAAAKDITEQKKAEQELQLISKVFKETADPILIVDLDGHIINCNKATVTAFGYARQELIGQSIDLLLPDGHLARAKELHQQCINNERVHNMEWVRKKKDGTVMPVLLTLSSLRDDQANPIGVASITKDISEIKAAEQELKNYRDHLEELVRERTTELEAAVQVAKEATQAKSDFLANMSHEIRTPLNAVIGFAHLALQTRLDDSQFDYLNKIQGSSKALLGIINDILDFSKIEAGKLSMETIEFHLDEVLETVTNIVGIKAQQKGLEVIFNIDPNLPQVLIGDPLRLGQILINLTGNARKFTQTGEIVLGCRQVASRGNKIELEFFVQDSGIGLTREQQEKLFQAFSQADSSTTRKYGGTGLGLFISKSLAEMMGGRIWVTGEQGKGTTFFFTAVMEKAGTRMPKALHPHDGFGNKKVLVVDDNSVCRTALSAMLQAMSFQVVQASSALEGIEEIETAADSHPFDVVLMDWKMPGMDGLQASKKIKAGLGIKVPSVVMVSAYAREDLMLEAGALGLDGYLVKPVSPSLLYDTIMTALGYKSAGQAQARRTAGLPSVESIRGARLLVVEDNDINQQVARGILEGNGFVVEMAENGRLGVEAVAKTAYDAVLMDIQMPEMDGYQASREIRKDSAFNDLPIIAMTANAMSGDREKAMDAGMNDHVAKPIDVGQLLHVLRKWVRPTAPLEAPATGTAADGANEPSGGTKFGELPGIDIQNGLGRFGGNTELFKDLLKKFAANQADVPVQIRQALDKQDMETARRLAHTAKGVAGNVGALELFKTATDLDAALKVLDMDNTHALMPVFETQLNRVIQGINALEEKEAGPDLRSLSGDDIAGIVAPLLAELKALLDEDDTQAADPVRQLKGMIPKGPGRRLLDQMAGQISGYEFDKAQETLKALCAEYNINQEG